MNRIEQVLCISLSLLLASCDVSTPVKSPWDTAACIAKFSSSYRQLRPEPQDRFAVRYLFDSEGADPGFTAKGIEGVAPNMTISEGYKADRMDERSAQRVFDSAEGEGSSAMYYPQIGKYLYRPGRSFSADEAQAHLAKMCSLGQQNIRLYRYATSRSRI